MADPRAIELEQQIQSAVNKQKRPDSDVSCGDDSEAFPTSDDHQLASCSASTSDQGPDRVGDKNRFHVFNRDDDEFKPVKNIRRRTRRKSSNSNPHDDDDKNEEEGEVDQ